MNRRSFIRRLALGAATFTILPGAGRVWVARRHTDLEILFDLIWKMKRDRESELGYDPNVIEICIPPGAAPSMQCLFPPRPPSDPLPGPLGHGNTQSYGVREWGGAGLGSTPIAQMALGWETIFTPAPVS